MSQVTTRADAGDGFRPAADKAGRRPGAGVVESLDHPQAALERAAASIAATEQEVSALWHETIDSGDRRLSDRLAEAGRALRGAALLLEEGALIGRPDPASAVVTQIGAGGSVASSEQADERQLAASPPSPLCQIAVERHGDEVVVRLLGSLTAASLPLLALTLATSLAEEVSAVELDLSAVEVLDVECVWMIGEAARLFGVRGSGFVVRGPRAAIGRLLDDGHIPWTGTGRHVRPLGRPLVHEDS